MESRPVRKITPRVRNQFQFLTAAATGLTAFGALAGAGQVTGHIAASFNRDSARKAAAAASDQTPVVVTKRRPHRTVVHTVVRTAVVNRASAGTVAAPATGGTIRSGGSSGSRTTYTAPSRPPAAPKPAPAPAPAPSSGS